MPKTDPSYENFWHSTGSLKTLPTVEQVIKCLEGSPKAKVEVHELNTTLADGWWSYDAVWMTSDGARVRGRLNMFDRHPRDDKQKADPPPPPLEYDAKSDPKSGYFHAFAVADRPWDPAWPSPLGMFLPRSLAPGYANIEYGQRNRLTRMGQGKVTRLVKGLVELPWMASVFTHDDESITAMLRGGEPLERPFIAQLPPSLYGRVAEFRVIGGTMRETVNKALALHGVQLPMSGAAILPPSARRRGLSRSDLEFPMDRPFVTGGDTGPLKESLVRMLASGVLEVDADVKKELRTSWTLLTESEKREQQAELLNSARGAVKELEDENSELLLSLASKDCLVEVLRAREKELGNSVELARNGEREARDGWRKDREELKRLRRKRAESDLGKALQASEDARRAAEEDIEAAEELLDEQTHSLTQLHRENTRLRRELARLGSTFSTLSTTEEVEPDTWESIVEQSLVLKHVVLGELESGIGKLRGHEAESKWIRRSWEALHALEDYARLKQEHGPEALPHFRAYLESSLAEYVIPQTRYSSSESGGIMRNGRFRAARIFSVPRQVDESGHVVMEAHVRIGSGKPPAPRMHLHDDTSGQTGKIFIGYIGPHLPNWQTN